MKQVVQWMMVCVGRWTIDVQLRLAEQWRLEEQTLRLLLSAMLLLLQSADVYPKPELTLSLHAASFRLRLNYHNHEPLT